ncbi:MAG: cytochrome c peroxidase [Bacteroidota bacterium]
MNTSRYLLLCLCILSIFSCQKDQQQIVEEIHLYYTKQEREILAQDLNLPSYPFNYRLEIPAHLGSLTINTNNSLATLGRVLFYDKNLSANGKVSCASCHKPELAFADNVAFSEGFNGQLTKRNSLSLGSFPSFQKYYGDPALVLTNPGFFWDERASSVSEQSRLSLEDPIEMGTALHELEEKLLSKEYYQVLFLRAFIERERAWNREMYLPEHFDADVTLALEAFVNSIGVFETRFDEGFASHRSMEKAFSNFSEAENVGKDLFNQHCSGCHNLSNASATQITVADNGLDKKYTDLGVGGVLGIETQNGLFKVPMLRNIALTAPYMHDGRFATLEQVVNHYSSGVNDSPNLHHLLRWPNGQAVQFNWSEEKKAALVAFLRTLTDEQTLKAEKYSDPFQ